MPPGGRGSTVLDMGTDEVWPAGVEGRAIEKADVAAWAELLAAVEKADRTGENYDAEDLLDELKDPKLDAAKDTLGLWSGGQLVGYAKLGGPDEVVDIHRVLTEGCVHPEWRDRGLGSGLLSWLIDRATAIHLERHPEAPGELSATTVSTNASALALFAAGGLEPTRYFFDMGRELRTEPVPDSPAADGLRLVPFDPAYDDALRLAHNEAFRDHWGSTPRDPESWKTWCTGSRAFRAAHTFLVLDGERIASYAIGYEYVADTAATGIQELYVGQVGTRRDYRGKGAARAALAKAMATAKEAGFQRVALGVDAENPTGALGLYEMLGFRTKQKWISHRLPLS